MPNSESLFQQQQSGKGKFQINVVMSYDEIAGLCEQLGYRDKLRLAQLLIQLARKEEEIQNPQSRIESKPKELSKPQNNLEIVQYVFDRIIKLKPNQRKTLKNSIRAMFQFQGGISDAEQERIIAELQSLKYIKIDTKNKVTYL